MRVRCRTGTSRVGRGVRSPAPDRPGVATVLLAGDHGGQDLAGVIVEHPDDDLLGASLSWVSRPSICQIPFGWAAVNRRKLLRGRFFGSCLAKPRQTRIRCTVARKAVLAVARIRARSIVLRDPCPRCEACATAARSGPRPRSESGSGGVGELGSEAPDRPGLPQRNGARRDRGPRGRSQARRPARHVQPLTIDPPRQRDCQPSVHADRPVHAHQAADLNCPRCPVTPVSGMTSLRTALEGPIR